MLKINTGVQDKSWRVRYNVAQQLYQLCEALGPDLSRYIDVKIKCFMICSINICLIV